jgi:hypothetical protein
VIKRLSLLLAVALMAVMLLAATSGVAVAKLTQVTTNPKGHETQAERAPEPPQDTDTVNGGGNEPPGKNKGDAVAG